MFFGDTHLCVDNYFFVNGALVSEHELCLVNYIMAAGHDIAFKHQPDLGKHVGDDRFYMIIAVSTSASLRWKVMRGNN